MAEFFRAVCRCERPAHHRCWPTLSARDITAARDQPIPDSVAPRPAVFLIKGPLRGTPPDYPSSGSTSGVSRSRAAATARALSSPLWTNGTPAQSFLVMLCQPLEQDQRSVA